MLKLSLEPGALCLPRIGEPYFKQEGYDGDDGVVNKRSSFESVKRSEKLSGVRHAPRSISPP
jgi:hypothetical protein